ncbi:hypothetical protein AKI39_14845 [Bordetella sp. H567]|nr:hypothetical protein AKI39_14845 [Bordetella sp. H567]
MKKTIATSIALALVVGSGAVFAADSMESKLEGKAETWKNEAEEKVQEGKQWEKREQGKLEKRAGENTGKAESAAEKEAVRVPQGK